MVHQYGKTAVTQNKSYIIYLLRCELSLPVNEVSALKRVAYDLASFSLFLLLCMVRFKLSFHYYLSSYMLIRYA